MGEKPVGGLIAIIAVALLSVITFGLVATNQSNRDAQVVEVTVSTSEEVVNAGDDGSGNQGVSPVAGAQSMDSNGDDGNSNTGNNENKDTGNFFSNRSQGGDSDFGGEENDNNPPALLQSSSSPSGDNQPQNTTPLDDNSQTNEGNNGNDETNEGNDDNGQTDEGNEDEQTGDNGASVLSVTQEEQITEEQSNQEESTESNEEEQPAAQERVVEEVQPEEPTPDKVCYIATAYVDEYAKHNNGGHAIYLPGIGGKYVPVDETAMSISFFDDGTAIIEGLVKDTNEPTHIFHVRAELSGKTNTPAPGGAKENELKNSAYNTFDPPGPIDVSSWHYYETMTGTVTGPEGTYFEGVEISFVGTGPYFQIGYGANMKNEKYGASAWFKYTVEKSTSSLPKDEGFSKKGDFNFNLPDCAPEPPKELEKLNVTGMCLVSENEWLWRVNNPNDVYVPYEYRLAGVHGFIPGPDGPAPPGESFFVTNSVSTMIIRWQSPVTGEYAQKTNGHSSDPCVGHVEFEKEWKDFDVVPEVAEGLVIYAESDVAKATCSYNESAEFVCEYLPLDGYETTNIAKTEMANNNGQLADLHVPFGTTYTVTETGLGDGWSVMMGANGDTTYNVVDGYLENWDYDVDPDRYCQHDAETQPPHDKYCVHTVVNKYTPQEFVCDSLYYVNHISNGENDSPLFRVTLDDATDRGHLEFIQNFQFDQVHIGASVDGEWMYGVDEDGKGVEIIDLDPSNGDDSIVYSSTEYHFVHVAKDNGGKDKIKNITQVAVSPYGDLYIGSASKDRIYRFVDVTTGEVEEVGQILDADNGNTPINIGGADIVFGDDGQMYLMTRSNSTLYAVNLADNTAKAIGSGKSTGLAILDKATGDFVYSDTDGTNEFVVLDGTDPTIEKGRYVMYLDGEPYHAVWGDMSGGCVEPLEDPDVELTILKEAKLEGQDIEALTVGQNFQYDITVTNNGPDEATGVYVTDVLPDGIDLLPPAPNGCSYTGNESTRTLICDIGSLDKDQSVTITVDVTATKVNPDGIENTAVVKSNEDDPKDSSDTVKVNQPPPPGNACDATNGHIPLGGAVNYTEAGNINIAIERRDASKAELAPTPEAGNQSNTFNFVSLGVDEDDDGFGGSIDLYFGEGLAVYPSGNNVNPDGVADFYVYETSWGHRFSPCEAYPETIIASILYKSDWYELDGQEVCRTGGFDIDGSGAEWAEAIRLTDITDPSYASDGDGYDVDGISCEPPADPPTTNPDPEYACVPEAIVRYIPGTTKNGGTIPTNRTSPESKALTIEDDDTLNFLSLGYDDPATEQIREGVIVYDFGEDSVLINQDSHDLLVVETSWGDRNRPWSAYPEQAEVFVSQDDITYYSVGIDQQDMSFDLDDAGENGLEWARYVMLVDMTSQTSNSGDAFDIDGIAGVNECGEPPVPPVASSCLAFEVVSYSPVNADKISDDRDDAWQAEAVENLDAPPVNFVSLGGPGGEIVLRPEEADSAIHVSENPTLYIWETTYGEGTRHKTCESYYETAKVYVRYDGGEWEYAGEVCRDGSVDLEATGLDYVDEIKVVDSGSTTPDGYDLDGLTCEPAQPEEPEEPPYDTCEMLFYSHNPDAPNEANLYQVYLNEVTGEAEMFLLDSLDGDNEWGDSHIASNADGTKLYLIENKAPNRLGVYDVATKSFDAIFDLDINGVTQAAVDPATDDLYIGSSKTNKLYVVDTSDGSYVDLGKVEKGGVDININGADIAFGADGTFYLATRATNKIYEVDLDTMMVVGEHIHKNVEMNGMTITNNGSGNFVYASRGADAFIRIEDDNSRTSFAAPASFNGGDVQWGDMATCITYDEPEEDDDKPKDPPEQCDALFNHVTNGSFEQPVVEHAKNWDVYTDGQIDGWDVDWNVPLACGGDEAVIELQNKDLNLATPADGDQYAELDSDCGGPSNRQGGQASITISQDILTRAGATYTLEFEARARRGTMELAVMWDGQPVPTPEPIVLTTEWQKVVIPGLPANDGTVTISFSDESNADSFGVFLDAVGVYEECDDTPPPTDGEVCIPFGEMPVGTSVEGQHGDVTLSTSSGNAKVLIDGQSPTTYGAPNGKDSRPSGCIVDGFADTSAKASRLHDYVFEFADGKIATDFSITMFDFGDYNPARATEHTIRLVGYDVDNNVVAEDVLTYSSSNAGNPRTSDFGDLYYTGDACDGADDGEIGVHDFNITNAEGIKTVKVLYENNGTNNYGGDRPSDPNIAFGEVCFQVEEEPEEPEVPTCETASMFFTDNSSDDNMTDLYSIYLNNGNAEMTLISDETGFGPSHIAASNDGKTVYFVENTGNAYLGVYDVASGEMTNKGSTGWSGVTQVALHPHDEVLYLGNANQNKLYTIDVTVDSIDPMAVELGPISHNGGTLNLNGADIVFDAYGTLYVATNAKDRIFEVDLDTMMTVAQVANIGHDINGLAIDDGEFVYAGQGKKHVTRTNDGDYPTVLGEGTFKFGNGDLSTVCVEPVREDPEPEVCEAGTGLGVATDFNVFSIGDFSGLNSDTEGRLAVGGNADLMNYSVGLLASGEWTNSLIVGGDLDFTNGQVNNGNGVVGGAATLTSVGGNPITDGVDPLPVDFATAAGELEALSDLYASFAPNGSAAFTDSTLVFTGTDPEVNIFDVDGADLESASGFKFDVPAGSIVLVNVTGSDVTLTNKSMNLDNGADDNLTLYNFNEAQTINLHALDFFGSLLAPDADVNFSNGVFNGTLVAASVNLYGDYGVSGQFDHEPFDGCIEEQEPEPETDLSIEKTGPEEDVYLGDDFVFTIVGTNNGDEDAPAIDDIGGTTITDYLPDNAGFVSATWENGDDSGECTLEDGMLICEVGALAVGESVTATVTMEATVVGTVVNTAAIDNNLVDDTNPDNNEDSDDANVIELCVTELDPENDLYGKIHPYGDNHYNYDGTSEWKGVVENKSLTCTYIVGMAAYNKNGNGSLDNQTLYDSDPEDYDNSTWGDGWDPEGIKVGPGETVTLRVTAPACATQLDLFYDASHYGVYNQYDQDQADKVPLVLELFNQNREDWGGSYGNKYGQRLLHAKHINHGDDCADPVDMCEGEQYSGWMITSSSIDNNDWFPVAPQNSLIVTDPVYIKSAFLSMNPNKVEYWLGEGENKQKVHTENSNPYYAMGDNNSWSPAADTELTIRAYHKDGCYVDQVIDVDVEEQQERVVERYDCEMTVMVGDTTISDLNNVYDLTAPVKVVSSFPDGNPISRVRYFVDEVNHVDDENAYPYVFLGNNAELTLEQAQEWAGDDGTFGLYIEAEYDGQSCDSVNVQFVLGQ